MTKEISESLEETWVVVEKPGYLGSKKEQKFAEWDSKYSEGNWRLVWQTADGKRLFFEDIFDIYVQGYVEYFKEHPGEADYLTQNYSFAYDETLISKDQALDSSALWEKPGVSNQFHHAALNFALQEVLGIPFKGERPIQIRGGKPGTPVETWPAGWKWHPGRIPCPNPDLIPKNLTQERKWWEEGTIEDLYQSAKVLEIKALRA